MMRKMALVSVALAAMLSSSIAAADVAWRTDSFDDLLKTAKAENKPIFIDFFTTWCGPCKMLDANTYPDAAVEKVLATMLPAKYDAEKDPWVALAKQYKIHAYPTLVVIGADGKEIDRWIGYLPPDEFADKIGAMAKGTSAIALLEKDLAKSPNDFDLLVQVGEKHAEAGRVEPATAALTKAMAQDPKNEKGKYPEILYELGDVNYGAGNNAEALKYFQRIAHDYPDWENINDAVARLAATQYRLGDTDAAVATYWKITENRQDDYKALNGFAWFCSQRKIGLDKALPVAIKAADLSKRDPGILDTLAEVYFAKGDYDNAIKVETEAASHDASDQYLKDQIEKYKKAKAADQARS
jgi:tetratricopeptide (TPR) repeat protein